MPRKGICPNGFVLCDSLGLKQDGSELIFGSYALIISVSK